MLNGLRCLSRASHTVLPPRLLFSATQHARRHLQHSNHFRQFTPLTPPDPAKLPKPKVRKARKPRRWLRRTVLFVAVGAGSVLLVDRYTQAQSLTRSLRTFYVGLVIGLDYKINFRAKPWFANSVEDVHRRSAQRIFDLLQRNGALYSKLAQAIAMQSAIMPPEFQKMFARMFDDAPQNEWADVERVVKEDFGKSVEEVFGVSFSGDPEKGVMERKARASASVAQVHWARLSDGREVAVKIQKREIAAQVGWDLWAFKMVSWAYSWWFDLPIHTLVPYISERLLLETDFENEANNSEEMRRLVMGEPRLRGKVYIPTVYRDLSSKRVMTAEWVEGISLWDNKESLTAPWQGGWRQGSPGAGGRKLEDPSMNARGASTDTKIPQNDLSKSPHNDSLKISKNDPISENIKPDRSAWRGPDGKGGLGLSPKEVMNIMVDLFSAQMFIWGVVHCDPHPGNLFVRRLSSGRAEVVLIDHGLYIRMTPQFRKQYAEFWKALISFDNAKIESITQSWGVNSPDIFASATLMRPYEGGDGRTMAELRSGLKGATEQERAYEMQMKMRAGVKQILGDESKWPKEILFIGRNLRIVQQINQRLGSPVNRIKITGLWASRALVETPGLSFVERAANLGRHIVFRTVLFGSDLVWVWYRIKQLLGMGLGMDDEIEAHMKRMAKDFGVELQHNVFDG